MEAPLEEVGADDPDPDIIGRDLVYFAHQIVMLLSGVDRCILHLWKRLEQTTLIWRRGLTLLCFFYIFLWTSRCNLVGFKPILQRLRLEGIAALPRLCRTFGLWTFEYSERAHVVLSGRAARQVSVLGVCSGRP
jgi:hypothetical protein